MTDRSETDSTAYNLTLYRSRPVKIEAIKLDDSNIYDVLEWITSNGTNARMETDPFIGVKVLYIETLEGMMVGYSGDCYIIRGTANEFYPCRNDIFEHKYDAIPWEDTTN